MKNEKMWSLLLHLGPNLGSTVYDHVIWDDEMWEWMLEEMPKAGINTLVLDLNDGVEYGSHPEIALKGAWPRSKLRRELNRLRALGITPIPKLNFAATHSRWLGPYFRKTSTPEYYRVANELIKEAYELFDGPEYIHIGMDEESLQFVENSEFVLCRQGELYWHDLRFLVDSVAMTGATPWVWSSPLFDHPEEFEKHFEPDEMIFSPYHYNALYPEHYTPISTRSEYLVYYNEGKYAEMGIEFVEQDPFLVHFMEVAIPLMKKGYKYVPCASTFNRCDWNHHDLVRYFKENAPDDQLIGFMSAPWGRSTPDRKYFYEETFRFFREAKDEFYPDN